MSSFRTPSGRLSPTRPVVFVVVGVVIAALLAILTLGVVFAPVGAIAAPYQPTAADGYLREPVSLDDDSPDDALPDFDDFATSKPHKEDEEDKEKDNE